jgi:integrase
MAHIERRPDRPKPWRARYRGPDGKERSRSFARKADAQRWLSEVETARNHGLWTDPARGRITFGAWLDQYWTMTADLRPKTIARDRSVLGAHALPWFGRMPLAAIEPLSVQAWTTNLLDQGLKPSTVRTVYQRFSRVMTTAVDAGMIARTPCRRIKLPKVDQEEIRFLSPADIGRLADAIRPEYRALVLLGAYGGLRIGEMAALRRHDVDFEHGSVSVVEILTEPRGHIHIGPPKTRASRRTVAVPSFVMDALAAHLAASTARDGRVFHSPRGRLFRPTPFRDTIWKAATTAAGLTGVRIHDLRHTAVALWIAAGANPKLVSARAGHTSVSFTLDRYGHLYPESDAELCHRLADFYAPPGVVRPNRGPGS